MENFASAEEMFRFYVLQGVGLGMFVYAFFGYFLGRIPTFLANRKKC